MIIEIKDLPTDRKVKHITFDITFEEDGTPVVQQVPSGPIVMPSPVYGPVTTPINPMQPPWTVTCDASANVPLNNLTSATTPEGPNVRAPKDIPPEMMNQEF